MVDIAEHIQLVAISVVVLGLVAVTASMVERPGTPTVHIEVNDPPSYVGNGTSRTYMVVSWSGLPDQHECTILVVAFSAGARGEAWRASSPGNRERFPRGGSLWVPVPRRESNGTASVTADLVFERRSGNELVEAVLLCSGKAIARDETRV